MLVIDELDSSSIDGAADVVSRQHAAARARCGGLPADATEQAHCAATLSEVLANGHRGFVARDRGHYVGVLCGHSAARGYAMFPAEGVAIDPDLPDATRVLAGLYAELAPHLVGDGAFDHYAKHVDWPPLNEAFANLGFGRSAVYATQSTRRRHRDTEVAIRIGGVDDLDAIVELSLLEMRHRFTPPIYSPAHPSSVDDVRANHVRQLDAGAVHFLATLHGEDIGLLTIERSSPAPRLCPSGQPYIGPTSTRPAARGRGVGRDLVEAALDWAFFENMRTVSVDFQPANPLGRSFWLRSGFKPTGYEVTRAIPRSYATEARADRTG